MPGQIEKRRPQPIAPAKAQNGSLMATGSSATPTSSQEQQMKTNPSGELPAPASAPSPERGEALPSNPSGVGKVEASPSPAAGSNQAPESASQAPVLHVTVALNEGLMKSPRVAAARALLGIQTAGYWAATQMTDPLFIRDNGLIAEQTIRQGGGFTYQPPWKIAFRLLAAKQQVKETKLEILNTLWQFRADVRRAYVELFVSQAYYRTLADLYELGNRLLQVSTKRFQAGDVPELDVLKARLATSQAQIDMEQGRRRITRAKQLLNNMLGRDIETPVAAPNLPPFQLRAEKIDLLPDFSEPVPPLRDLLEQAFENRLELRINAQQIKLAQAQLRNAYGNILPDQIVNVGGSTTGNIGLGPKLHGQFFTFNLEMPVFTFSQGDITRLRATIHQYQLNKYAVMNQVQNDVTSAYNTLLQYRERIRVYQEHVLADSEEVARLARRSYEVGQSDITSTLQAQQANVQVRSQYLDSVTAYQQAFTDLEQAVGEPLE